MTRTAHAKYQAASEVLRFLDRADTSMVCVANVIYYVEPPLTVNLNYGGPLGRGQVLKDFQVLKVDPLSVMFFGRRLT